MTTLRDPREAATARPGTATLPLDGGAPSAWRTQRRLASGTLGMGALTLDPMAPEIAVEVLGATLAGDIERQAEAQAVAEATTEAASLVRTTVLPTLKLAPGGRVPTLDATTRTRYRERARLGAGGIGEVTLAVDEDIGRSVAIKRLKCDDEGAVMRFVDEVQVMGRLDHPNIVPVHDVGCDADGRLFFVMKRLEGDTLEAIIERLRDGDPSTEMQFPIAVRVEIMMSVLRALQFAHAQRTIHRDLKPSNIMVGRFGEVSVVDWGIAKRLDDPVSSALDRASPPRDEAPDSRRPFRTRVGALLGTPAYMSPEQARGDNDQLDETSDLFSLSLVFYELLALQHPFERARDLVGLLEAIRTGEPPPLVDFSSLRGAVSVELANVVHRGLAKKREDRFQSAGEMIEALHDVVDGSFPITCPVTFMKRSLGLVGRIIDAYPRTSGMSFMASVLGLVVAFVGLGAGWWWR